MLVLTVVSLMRAGEGAADDKSRTCSQLKEQTKRDRMTNAVSRHIDCVLSVYTTVRRTDQASEVRPNLCNVML